MVRKESFGNYPAMVNILKAVYEGSLVPMDAALRIEGRYFCDLLLNPVSGNMIRSLFLSKQALEKGEARPEGQKKGEIRKLGVVGAGFMGAGVAYVSAMAGIDVVLVDRDDASAQKGKQRRPNKDTKHAYVHVCVSVVCFSVFLLFFLLLAVASLLLFCSVSAVYLLLFCCSAVALLLCLLFSRLCCVAFLLCFCCLSVLFLLLSGCFSVAFCQSAGRSHCDPASSAWRSLAPQV